MGLREILKQNDLLKIPGMESDHQDHASVEILAHEVQVSLVVLWGLQVVLQHSRDLGIPLGCLEGRPVEQGTFAGGMWRVVQVLSALLAEQCYGQSVQERD